VILLKKWRELCKTRHLVWEGEQHKALHSSQEPKCMG